MKQLLATIFGACLAIFALATSATENPNNKTSANAVIIYVWDGLRPDSVSPENTPNLYLLMKQGTQFIDNHSSYPTFTMMNAASFATGDRAGKTSFFGNVLWHPGLTGVDAAGKPVDFQQPVFTEDYKILQDLNKDELFFVNTLFNVAHAKGLTTAAIGKSGPAFMQDYLSQGYTLDERHVYPLSFAKNLQKDGFSLPKLSPNDFKAGELVLSQQNGDPTKPDKLFYLADGVTPDPTDQQGSPYDRPNEYMVNIFLKEILTKKLPELSVIWMRNPDTTEHNYGPGTADYRDALKANDKILGELLQTLKSKDLLQKTDIIIVSDHAHSSVSGSFKDFPLRAIKDGNIGKIDPNGYSVSGEVRSADLLTKAGFHAFDGAGCIYNPVLSGIKKDNTPLYPTQIDKTGSICGKVDTKYTTPAYEVPKNLPSDAIVVAANGGSDYFYVPSHDKKIVEKLIEFLASHTQYDAIFADSMRYGKMKGAIPLETVGLENPQGRSPDVVAGFAYNAEARINGLNGIEFSDYFNMRGMHGSFSPIDVHNFLMASGPDFRKHFVDKLPSGNVDVTPTVAAILGLPFGGSDGRVLSEALVNYRPSLYNMRKITIRSEPIDRLTMYNALNERIPKTRFQTELYAKVLKIGNQEYNYFDSARGVR